MKEPAGSGPGPVRPCVLVSQRLGTAGLGRREQGLEGRMHMAPVSQQEQTLEPLLSAQGSPLEGRRGLFGLTGRTVYGGEKAPRLSPLPTPYRQQ